MQHNFDAAGSSIHLYRFGECVRHLTASRARRLPGLVRIVRGTVVNGGYGSLWERLDTDPYRATARAFFFTASCLARF